MKTSKQILDLIVDLGKAIKTEREANQKQMALLNSNKDPKWDDEGNRVYTLKEEIASTRHGHAFANLLKIQEEIKIIALETIGEDASNHILRKEVYEKMTEVNQNNLKVLEEKEEK